MKTKQQMILAGEYCGICGKTAKTSKEYIENKNRYWFCSKECLQIANERDQEENKNNIALQLNNFLYKLTDNKNSFMGSDGIANKSPAMQYDFEVDNQKFTVYLINNTENEHN